MFLSFKGIPESKKQESFIYEIEDYIMDTCQNYSLNSKNQERNLIDDLKQSCRKIIREKTEKKPIQILQLLDYNGFNRINNSLCNDMVDNILFSFHSIGIKIE